MVHWNGKIDLMPIFSYLLINTRSSLLAGIWWFVCTYVICQNGLIFVFYPVLSRSPFPPNHAYSCFLHSFIKWLTVSSPPQPNQHLLFCVLTIFFIWLVHLALFWLKIKRDSISLFIFHLLNHAQVIYCSTSLDCCLLYPYSCFSFYF